MRAIRKPRNLKKIREVFEIMVKRIEDNKDADDVKFFSDIFNEWLDSLLEDDYFGTEGQNDPRGDRRE